MLTAQTPYSSWDSVGSWFGSAVRRVGLCALPEDRRADAREEAKAASMAGEQRSIITCAYSASSNAGNEFERLVRQVSSGKEASVRDGTVLGHDRRQLFSS